MDRALKIKKIAKFNAYAKQGVSLYFLMIRVQNAAATRVCYNTLYATFCLRATFESLTTR